MKFLIITPVYNSRDWIKLCISSVLDQDYDNFLQVIVDDGSTDGTYEVAKELVGNDPRFVVMRTSVRQGALHSHTLAHSRAVQDCGDNDVIVHLDGDDWFKHKHVLSKLKEVYEKNECWATYGSYECTDPTFPMVAREFKERWTFRDQVRRQWIFSAVRTFKAFLWSYLSHSDFLDSQGKFLTRACDVAIFLPILEMAGKERVKFVNEPLYVYNRDKMNDDKENLPDQIRCTIEVLRKPSKSELEVHEA